MLDITGDSKGVVLLAGDAFAAAGRVMSGITGMVSCEVVLDIADNSKEVVLLTDDTFVAAGGVIPGVTGMVPWELVLDIAGVSGVVLVTGELLRAGGREEGDDPPFIVTIQRSPSPLYPDTSPSSDWVVPHTPQCFRLA